MAKMKVVEFKESRLLGRRIQASCGDCREKLDIYAPKPRDKDDDLYEIGGVIGSRAEFKRLFKRAGIL